MTCADPSQTRADSLKLRTANDLAFPAVRPDDLPFFGAITAPSTDIATRKVVRAPSVSQSTRRCQPRPPTMAMRSSLRGTSHGRHYPPKCSPEPTCALPTPPDHRTRHCLSGAVHANALRTHHAVAFCPPIPESSMCTSQPTSTAVTLLAPEEFQPPETSNPADCRVGR